MAARHAPFSATSRADCEALDASDPLRGFRKKFQLPEEMIYLDGNSLGAMPGRVVERVSAMLGEEWAHGLVTSWNGPDWLDAPTRIGDKIGTLLGAAPGQVVVTDNTSVNLFKLLGAALGLDPSRKVILTEKTNFPTDLYVADGIARMLPSCEVRRVDREAVAGALDSDVSVLMLTHVDYRTGEMLDMEGVTRQAHHAGALMLWDLCHSAGAVPLEIDLCQVDLAVGCTYKFLNGGPGAPAFSYVSERHGQRMRNPIPGWFGHADTFAFAPTYDPAPGIARFQTGTPALLGLASLEAAIDLWLTVDMTLVREKSLALGDLLIGLARGQSGADGLELVSPPTGERRGSQVSFRHGHAYAVSRALAARGVIVDCRPPDIVRFGLTPLYTRYIDVWDAAAALHQVLAAREYVDAAVNVRRRVP